MNLLYLAHRIPYPPDKGDKIRSFNTVKYLAARHRVWCACFVDEPADFEHVTALRKYCSEVVALPLNRARATARGLVGLAAGRTMTETFYRDGDMTRAIRGLCDSVRFDAVLVFSSSMGPYAAAIDVPRKVIDFCDLDSRKWADCARRHPPPRSWLLHLEARRLAALERELVERFDATILIGEHEITDAEGWAPAADGKLHFVSNGADVPSFDTPPRYARGVVGFVGDMRYHPNEDAVCWFVKNVWPQVAAARREAVLEIVGRGPSRRVRRLAGVRRVRVVGPVDRVTDYLRRFQVSIAPLRIARGIQNKVLEAMAAARPVVTTTAAAAGIYGIDGQDFLISDDARGFADHVIQLLRDPEECRALGESGRRYVIRNHNWETQVARLAAIVWGTSSTTGGLLRPG